MAIWATHVTFVTKTDGAERASGHPFVVELFPALRTGQPRRVMESFNTRKR